MDERILKWLYEVSKAITEMKAFSLTPQKISNIINQTVC